MQFGPLGVNIIIMIFLKRQCNSIEMNGHINLNLNLNYKNWF